MHFYNCLLPGGSTVKNLPATGNAGSIPGWGKFTAKGNGNPLQYPCHGQRSLVGCSPWGHKRVRNDLPTKQHFYDWICMNKVFSIYAKKIRLGFWSKFSQVIVVQSLSHVQLFVTPWAAAYQASMSFTISQSLLKLVSIELVILSNHLNLFSSCSQFFPALGSFPMSQLFTSDGQSIGTLASASVLPMSIECISLGLTGLISLLSKGLLRVFSSTTI